jgi:hypothetical protein
MWEVVVVIPGRCVTYTLKDEPTDNELDCILYETGATSARVNPPEA